MPSPCSPRPAGVFLLLLPVGSAHRLHRDHHQPRGRSHRAPARPTHHEPLARLLEPRLLFRRPCLGADSSRNWGQPAARTSSSMIPLVLIGTVLLLGRFDPAPRRTGTVDRHGPAFAAPHARHFGAGRGHAFGDDHGRRRHRLVGDLHDRRVRFVTPFSPALPWRSAPAPRPPRASSPTASSSAIRPVRRAGTARHLGLGVLCVFFAAADWMALLGFGLMGVGTSAIFPLAMSAAAQRTDRPAATNVAALAQISFVRLPARPAAARLRRRALGHPLVVRHRDCRLSP